MVSGFVAPGPPSGASARSARNARSGRPTWTEDEDVWVPPVTSGWVYPPVWHEHVHFRELEPVETT